MAKAICESLWSVILFHRHTLFLIRPSKARVDVCLMGQDIEYSTVIVAHALARSLAKDENTSHRDPASNQQTQQSHRHLLHKG